MTKTDCCQERPNWVEARANCTLEGTFEQIVETIQHDIACFNKLPVKQRPGAEVSQHRPDQMENNFYVGYGSPERITKDDYVRIHRTMTTLQVFRKKSPLFTVEREWNEEKLRCDLKIDGTVHSLWQISQKAIGSLLFPET